ncbi:HET-domain-containing protein, partial [Piedraia hortae CBS 480.64]
MRLLDARTYKLKEFPDDALPPYAILSHTWTENEASFEELHHASKVRVKVNRVYKKLAGACFQARKDGLDWLWIDTCCINKDSSGEWTEAVNSMYRWYENSEACYVFLDDLEGSCPVLSDSDIEPSPQSRESLSQRMTFWSRAFANCRWFTRSWTLPELIAPRRVKFYGKTWRLVGTKATLVRTIARITGVDVGVLTHYRRLTSVSVAQRFSWAANRRCARVEDRAYSLLGIFGISMSILYGEGNRAFARLQEEIMRFTVDLSIFALSVETSDNNELMAESPDNFSDSKDIVSWGRPQGFHMT